MNKKVNTVIAMVVLVCAFAVSEGRAQGIGPPQLNVSIPFSFMVGEKALPSGQYLVSIVNSTSDQRILQLRSKDGRYKAVVITTGVIGKAVENGKLTFHRLDEQYFFAAAWMSGDDTGCAASKSKAELRMERESARPNTKSDTVAVNAR